MRRASRSGQCASGSRAVAVLDPASIAIIGASNDRNKVGGRPVDYLQRFGFQGRIYPVNPGRSVVQGLRCYPTVADLPEVPDLAIVAGAGGAVAEAVRACAAMGVGTAVILSSGFAETGADGADRQRELCDLAARAGMRLVGPNSQGIANFGIGAVANFSTMFTQTPPRDGPVAIVSQSGATSAALYSFLREQDIGVRYVLATGNESDLSVPEFALAVARDPAVRLIVLYMESIRNPKLLAKAAEVARARGVPIVALKAGRSPGGAAAALSHTGALVNEDKVVDAFFRRHGIWRARDVAGVVQSAALYLKYGVLARRRSLVVISNSGSSCVMSADIADDLGLELARLSAAARGKIAQTLESFATSDNPIDLTTALLGDSGCAGKVLAALEDEPGGDLVLFSVPVAGEGYDLERIADDVAAFEARTGRLVVVTGTLPSIRSPFGRRGLCTFATEGQALTAVDQLTRHARLLESPLPQSESRSETQPQPQPQPPAGTASVVDGPGFRDDADTGSSDGAESRFLDEAGSLAYLASRGVPVVSHTVCDSVEVAVAAWRVLDAPVAVKACSERFPHKSEHGLIHLNRNTADEVRRAYRDCVDGMAALGVVSARVIVARMCGGRRELAVGARLDPVFGPVVMVGDGGRYVEALPDFAVLMPPFGPEEAMAALRRLRIAPLFGGVRGEAPMDVDAVCRLLVLVGDLYAGAGGTIASLDLNPVMVGSAGEGVRVLDALVELAGNAARRQR